MLLRCVKTLLALSLIYQHRRDSVAIGGIADMPRHRSAVPASFMRLRALIA
jgi:hypothetical protein